jgi:hypothetical protein
MNYQFIIKQSIRGLFYSLLTLLVTCLSMPGLHAQYHTSITGGVAFTNTSIAEAFEPTKFNNTSKTLNSGYNTTHRYASLKNTIELKIDRDALIATNLGRHEVTVTYTLQYYTVDFSTVLGTFVASSNTFAGNTLSVIFDPAVHGSDKEIDVYALVDGLGVPKNVVSSKLTITQITKKDLVSNVTTTLTNLSSGNSVVPLILTNMVDVEIDEDLAMPASPGLASSITPGNVCQKDLTLSWAAFPGAKSYELEYVFVDYWVNTATAYAYDFKNNSTRIQLNATNYVLPLVYEKGYILYRVRGLGVKPGTSGWKAAVTNWTMPDRPTTPSGCTGPINLTTTTSCSGFGLVDLSTGLTGFAPGLNWQYQVSFTENTKNKALVGYFDGMMRTRQSITVLNSENKAIVGQEIYDFVGRPAIKPLPVPDLSSGNYCFRPNFNKSRQSLTQYNWKNFDADYTGACGTTKTSEMDWQNVNTVYGAAWYYSQKNSSMSLGGTQNYFIPMAEGYPFIQTEYTNDNTGRIQRISGLGNQHRLKGYDDANAAYDSTHETRYIYGKPSQEELYMMFGSEVGDASHYEKNIAIDENGQASVSYVDQFGRTIATALTGNPSSSWAYRALSGNIQANKTLTTTFTNTYKTKDAIVTSEDVYASVDGSHTFQYTVTPEILSQECMPQGVCFTCIYDLTISIRNSCGAEMIPGGAVTRKVGNIEPAKHNNSCSAVLFTLYQTPLSINLPKGTYRIEKRLTVNKEAFDIYKQQYLEQSNCITGLEGFVAEEEALINQRECNYTCETCQSDLAFYTSKISEMDTRIANYLTDLLPLEELQRQKSELVKMKSITGETCDEICKRKNPCEQLYAMMIQDVTPGGQYAEYRNDNGDIVENNRFSLMNTTASELGSSAYHWRSPSSDYKDVDGNIVLIEIIDNKPEQVSGAVYYNENGSAYTFGPKFIKPQGLKNMTDFIMYFQSSWAEALVSYHPEYSCWQHCNDVNGFYEYDQKLMNIKTMSVANHSTTGGYMNPINSMSLGHNPNDMGMNLSTIYPSITANQDPLTSSTYAYSGNILKTHLDYKLKNMVTSGGVTYTAWQMLEFYRAAVDAVDGHCADDLLWLYYRAMYLNAKQEVLKNYYDYWTCDAIYNTINGQVAKQRRFFLALPASDLVKQGLETGNQALLTGDPNGIRDNVILAVNTGEIARKCDTTCNRYADKWMKKLEKCSLVNAGFIPGTPMWNAVRTALINVCRDGCDVKHTYGSSSINPALTGKPYKSFHEVLSAITYVQSGTTYTVNLFSAGVCDELLITWPMPYDHDYFAYENGDANNCACDNSRYLQANIDAIRVDCPTYTPEGTPYTDCACSQASEDKKKFLLSTREIPEANRCNTCYTCVEVYNAAQHYYDGYKDVALQGNAAFPDLVTAYLNRYLKLNMSYPEYKDFISKCYGVDQYPDNRGWDSVFNNKISFSDLMIDSSLEFMPAINDQYKGWASVINGNQWNLDHTVYSGHDDPTWLASSDVLFLDDIDGSDATDPVVEAQKANIICNCKKILNAWKASVANGMPFEVVLNNMYPGHGFAPGTAVPYYMPCLRLYNGFSANNAFNPPLSGYTINGTWTAGALSVVQSSMNTSPISGLKDKACTDDAKKGDLKPLDDCACKKIIEFKAEYDALPFGHAPYTSFDDFVTQNKKMSAVPGFDKLYNKCMEYYRTSLGEDIGGNPVPWNPVTGFNTDAKNHLKKDVDFWEYKISEELVCTPTPTGGTNDPPAGCSIDCQVIRNFLANYLLTNPMPSSVNSLFPLYTQAQKVFLVWDYIKTTPNAAVTTWLNSMRTAFNAYMQINGEERCKNYNNSVDKIMNMLKPCMPSCPEMSCTALTKAIQDFIVSRQQYNISNPGTPKYIPPTYTGLGLDEMGKNTGTELYNYYQYSLGQHAFDRPWTDMATFANDMLAELNTKFSNAPYCTKTFTAKFIAEMLKACNPPTIDPVTQSPCKVCYRLNNKLKLTDLQAFLNRIAKGDGGMTNTGVDQMDKSNWKLKKNPLPSRYITEYYGSSSSLYTGGTDEDNLRYTTAGYPMPPQLFASIQDNVGHLFQYTMYFPGDQPWLHWGEIIKFANIRVEKPAGCTVPSAFLMDVDIWMSQIQYAYFKSSTGITLAPESITVGGYAETGYRHKIVMTGFLVTQKLAYKMKCPGPCIKLCNKPIWPKVDEEDDCAASQYSYAYNNAQIRYKNYIDKKLWELENTYYKKCLSAKETLTDEHPLSEYHYSLYYYDRAGLLIKTVPPEGSDVRFLNQAQLNSRITACKNFANNLGGSSYHYTNHNLYTYSRYNSLGQLVRQNTPDAGISRFWYDKLGRVMASQNARQYARCNPGGGTVKSKEICTYTQYDALGRIMEVGEKEYVYQSGLSPYVNNLLGPGLFANNNTFVNDYFYQTGTNTQVTRNYYDDNTVSSYTIWSPVKPGSTYTNVSQQNLRKRIVATALFANGADIYPTSSTHYSYDVHGNVDHLWQHTPALSKLDNVLTLPFSVQSLKDFAYTYDLLSGNVNTVVYQPGMLDQWMHKYAYDADNRLSSVSTSRDGYIWQKDGKYDYLTHGPLGRMVIGDRAVQGVDYAYTIQGWLKNVNSDMMHEDVDMGKDGGSPFYGRRDVARDAFGFSLQYFKGDYKPIDNTAIGSPMAYPVSVNKTSSMTSDVGNNIVSLYNGNVTQMVTTLPDASVYNSSKNITAKPLATTYYYDQLNRLAEVRAFDNFSPWTTNYWDLTGQTGKTKYAEEFSYDANGNILSAKRNGNNAGVTMAMDNMTYQYNVSGGRLQDNKLYHVNDAVSSSNYSDLDIDDQGVFGALATANYRYDEIGNLVHDEKESISTIEWTLYGKVKSITYFGANNKANLEFGYNAAGQRLYKLVKPRTAGVLSTQKDWKTTWYMRDGSGTPVATYLEHHTEVGSDFTDTLTLTELAIYGSARLGQLKADVMVAAKKQPFTGYTAENYAILNAEAIPDRAYRPAPLTAFTFSLGAKRYELSNHLGNVLAVVSDRKIMVDKGTYSGGYYVNATLDNQRDLYDPEYYNFGMYYAFGAPMPGTTYTKTKSYRYGFNGMEKESDVYGEGNAYTTEYRMMDARLGKWFSKDMVVKPWESPYAVNSNSPLYLIDPLGLDPVKPWNYVQRLFHKDFKVRANKVAAENNVDEKNVNYNEVDPNTDQKYASVQLGTSSSEDMKFGVSVKKFWDGKRLKERPLSFFERLDRRVLSWKGRPGDEVMSWEPAWMRPGNSDPINTNPKWKNKDGSPPKAVKIVLIFVTPVAIINGIHTLSTDGVDLYGRQKVGTMEKYVLPSLDIAFGVAGEFVRVVKNVNVYFKTAVEEGDALLDIKDTGEEIVDDSEEKE